MTVLAKPQSLVGALPATAELSAAALFDAGAAHTNTPLVFHYDGRGTRLA